MEILAVTSRIVTSSRIAISEAARALSDGELVVFPTETVYGLGADARSDRAVTKIYAAKGRPSFNPLIAHVLDIAMARTIATLDWQSLRLMEHFWPGPLTIVVPKSKGTLSELACAGLDTVAIRAPAHPVARNLLSLFGAPVVAPSANVSGGLSPTSAKDADDAMLGRVATILDGGACHIGVESTIVQIIDETPCLLRPGGISAEVIASCLGKSVHNPPLSSEAPTAPGALTSHYAPNAMLRLNVTSPMPNETWLGFGPECEPRCAANLSKNSDLIEAAANLFRMLRALDVAATRIAVAPIPSDGIGAAINDRLTRAAAPR
jgi:L-threonylcarbamoyladenylate synthase